VTPTLGAATSGIEWLTANPPDGLVVAALGGGHVPRHWVSPLASLAERRPVVLSSRVATVWVLERTYAFPGSGRDLLPRGLIAARGKSSIALRLLLVAAMGLDDHGLGAAQGFFSSV
jgi:L-asparaginase